MKLSYQIQKLSTIQIKEKLEGEIRKLRSDQLVSQWTEQSRHNIALP
jgi:hypothetical protein